MKRIQPLFCLLLLISVFEVRVNAELNPPQMVWGKTIERVEDNDYFQHQESLRFFGTLDFYAKRFYYQYPKYYIDIFDFYNQEAAQDAFENAK